MLLLMDNVEGDDDKVEKWKLARSGVNSRMTSPRSCRKKGTVR